MEKRNNLGILLAGVLAGGAIYSLFFTERGRKLLDRLVDTAAEKLDDWLADLEQQLAEAERGSKESA